MTWNIKISKLCSALLAFSGSHDSDAKERSNDSVTKRRPRVFLLIATLMVKVISMIVEKNAIEHFDLFLFNQKE